MIEDRKKIAVLIDYDNFNQEEYIRILLEELSDMGDVLLKYAFYSNLDDKTIRTKFINYGIQPMSQIAYSKGKNAVDIRMTIEAMRLLNKSFINTVCLASSDCDFTPLVHELIASNITVIGAGDNKATEQYKTEFNNFISVEKINSAPVINESNNGNGEEIKQLVQIINKIIDNNDDDDGQVLFSLVVQTLKNEMKDFNPKNYGAKNKNALPFFKSILSKYYDTKTVKKALVISRRVSASS